MNTTMTVGQVAEMYKVSTKTIKRKITKLKLGIDTSSLLYPKDLCKILDALGQPEDLASRRQNAKDLFSEKIIKILVFTLMLALPQRGDTQIIYATGEVPPIIPGSLIKINLNDCSFCTVALVNDGTDLDLTLLPNGNFINSSGSIKVFDPPNQNPIFTLNVPQVAVGNILNPSGNLYIATQQGLGEFNPTTNQFTYIGNWPASFLPVVEMELWYVGGQLYGYFGFPVQQVAQIDVSNPGNSAIVGAINTSDFIQGACNVGGTVYMAIEKAIYQFDPATGNLSLLCDFSNTSINILGISSVPTGFPDYPCICNTNAGSIVPQGLTNYCVNETATFIHNGNENLDNNDLLQYVLFSNPNDTAGSVIVTSSTPNFTFTPPMQTGVTYYMAAAAGNNLNGNVDLNDPCIDFSNANPVIWRPLPTVSFSAANPNVCAGACTTVTATFTGTAPFILTYTSSASGTVTLNFPSSIGTFQVCAAIGTPPGAFILQATALTDAWCTCQ